HGLVVRRKRRASCPVVDEIHVAAEVRVPHEAWILLREMFGAEAEVVARQELNRPLGRGLARARQQRERQERATNHSASFVRSNSARRASSCSMRFFSSGSRRKTAAARRHSRASIAG